MDCCVWCVLFGGAAVGGEVVVVICGFVSVWLCGVVAFL